MNKKKPSILCIDDEERVLRSLQLLFDESHQVFTTTSPAEYEKILTDNNINVVICDQRMPECLGTDLLEKTRDLSPNAMRILLTGYADLPDVVDAINKGEIFRYVTKPWDLHELKNIVEKATEISFIPDDSNDEKQPITGNQTISASNNTLAAADNLEKPTSGLPILLLADGTEMRENLEKTLEGQYTIYQANTIETARQEIEKHNISVILSEMVVGEMLITPLISTLKKEYPSVMSIVLTDLQDSGALIDLINTGQIYRCLPKSVSGKVLYASIKRALMRHTQLQTNPTQQHRYQVEAPKSPTQSRSVLSGLFGNTRET